MTATAERLAAAKAYLAERGLDGRHRDIKGSVVLANFRGPAAQRAAAGHAPQRRAFDAATFNRLTAGWQAATAAIDADLRAGLDTVRARSRELAQNNEYAVRFLAMVRANLIGPAGYRLIARVENAPGKADNLANDSIEWAWWNWSRKGVGEVGGRHTWLSACNTMATHLARDGEILIRFWRGAAARNPHGFAFQMLDPMRIDTHYNRDASSTQNAIVMGVEIDALSRPVAYWLRSKGGAQISERVPAADILHAYVPIDAEQTRGLPWMHAAIRRLHDLGGYREAAIIAARIGAAKMGFYTVDAAADPAEIPDGYAADGVPYQSAEPGEFGVLPHGVGFQQFDPAYPHEQFGTFITAALRGIAAGLGVSYHGLSGDLTAVSFSSIRSGTIEERDQWRVLQTWFADAVLEPVYTEWLRMALLSGAIKMPNGSALPAAKLDKFAAHTWQARTWEWVDPESDANAIVTKLGANLTTLTHEAGKQGLDLEEILQTKQRERELYAQYGIPYPGDTPAPKPGAAADADA